MKRISLLIVAILSGVIAQAHNFKIVNDNSAPVDDIYLLESSSPFKFDKGKTVELDIDFSQAEIVEFDRDYRTVLRNFGSIDKYNADHGEDYVKDWPDDLSIMTVFACKNLTNALKSEFIPEGYAEKTDYRVVVKIGLFEFGHFVAIGGAKDGGTITKGLIEIYDAGDNLMAVYDINYLRGMNVGYGNGDRVREWGKMFSKAFKKAL